MKKLFFVLVTLVFGLNFTSVHAQMDVRLAASKEIGPKAQDFYGSNIAEYNFLVFQLDNSWFLKSKSEISDTQKAQLIPITSVVSQDGHLFDPIVLSNPSTFNLFLYNFQRSETKTVGYDLGNDQVLVFYSIEKLREIYSQKNSK